MAAEALLAAAVLVAMAIALRPPTDRARPETSRSAQLTAAGIAPLLGDIAAVGPSGPTAAQVGRLRADLDRARRLPPPRAATSSALWKRALADIDAATRPGGAGSTRPAAGSAAGSAAYGQLTAAGEALLVISQSLPGGPQSPPGP